MSHRRNDDSAEDRYRDREPAATGSRHRVGAAFIRDVEEPVKCIKPHPAREKPAQDCRPYKETRAFEHLLTRSAGPNGRGCQGQSLAHGIWRCEAGHFAET